VKVKGTVHRPAAPLFYARASGLARSKPFQVRADLPSGGWEGSQGLLS